MTTSKTYSDIESRLKLTFPASSATNNLPTQSEVAGYITAIDARLTILIGTSTQSDFREELVIEGACSMVKDAINSLAQNQGAAPKYTGAWKQFDDLIAAYNPKKSRKDFGVYDNDYSATEWG